MTRLLRLSLLGAVDGLLFGAAVEVLRRIYTPIFLEYYTNLEIEEASRAGRTIPSYTRFIGGYWEIPLLCLVVFAVVIPFTLSLLKRYKLSPPVLWQVSGIFAASVAVLIHAWLNPFGHNTDLLALPWRLLFCLAIVSFVNLLYELVLGSVSGRILREVYR